MQSPTYIMPAVMFTTIETRSRLIGEGLTFHVAINDPDDDQPRPTAFSVPTTLN